MRKTGDCTSFLNPPGIVEDKKEEFSDRKGNENTTTYNDLSPSIINIIAQYLIKPAIWDQFQNSQRITTDYKIAQQLMINPNNMDIDLNLSEYKPFKCTTMCWMVACCSTRMTILEDRNDDSCDEHYPGCTTLVCCAPMIITLPIASTLCLLGLICDGARYGVHEYKKHLKKEEYTSLFSHAPPSQAML